jgi:hypothetical protein
MKWKVTLSVRAKSQIDTHFRYYELQQAGLGERFLDVLLEHVDILERTPFAQLRYDNVRCIPVKGFPFMLHFTVDEAKKSVNVQAVIHTSLNPKTNWGNTNTFVSEPDYQYRAASK